MDRTRPASNSACVAFPASAIAFSAEHLLVAGGGGPGSSGIPNAVAVYSPALDLLSTTPFASSDDSPWCMASCPELVLVGVVHFDPLANGFASKASARPATFPAGELNRSFVLFSFAKGALSPRFAITAIKNSADDFPTACAFSSDAKSFATGSDLGVLNLADIADPPVARHWAPVEIAAKIYDLCFHKAQIVVVTAPAIHIIDSVSGKFKFKLVSDPDCLFRCGKLLHDLLHCVVNKDRSRSFLYVYDLNSSLSPPKVVSVGLRPCVSIAVSADIVAMGLSDSTIVLLSNYVPVQRIACAHDGPITALALSQDFCFSVGLDRKLRRWSLQSTRAARTSPYFWLAILVLMLALLFHFTYFQPSLFDGLRFSVLQHNGF